MKTIPIVALLILNPALAAADACHDEIIALFDGGALDPFARPPHRYVNTVTGPEGGARYAFEVVIETPVRTIAGIQGVGPYSMVIGSDTWTGPTFDGPWSETPNSMPEDHEGHQRNLHAQQRANVTEALCPGVVDVDGTPYYTVQYATRTDPNPDMGNNWFGAYNTVYIDADTNRVMRWDMTDFANSWSEGVTKDNHVILYQYDLSISVVPPAN